MSDPRAIAADLLDRILGQGAPLDGAMAEHRGLHALPPRDRAFVRRLLATSLRRHGEINAIVKARLQRPLPARHGRIRAILHLGAAELVFLGTPAHAAVDGAVTLARRYRKGALAGLVNAVLRRIAREGVTSAGDDEAARLDTPGWLWKRWERAYGAETTRAIALAHLSEPPLDLTLAPGADAAGWARRLAADPLPTGTLRRIGGGAVSELDGFEDGAWWVQDAAAALPARLLGDVSGKHVIDLCAAPGGKTMQLAAAGAHVTAVDLSDARLALLADNLARAGLSAEIVCADGAAFAPDTPADAVLLDAPCTATGTIRRHPDIPWRRREGDIAKAVATQDRLLAAAAGMLKPGGTLIYAVCSLEPEEGPGRIEAALAAGLPLRRDPLSPGAIQGLEPEMIDADGALRTLPCHWAGRGGMDGFYAARLIRD